MKFEAQLVTFFNLKKVFFRRFEVFRNFEISDERVVRTLEREQTLDRLRRKRKAMRSVNINRSPSECMSASLLTLPSGGQT